MYLCSAFDGVGIFSCRASSTHKVHRTSGAEVIKLFINLRLKQADWLILSIRSVSTNQHA